MVNLQIIHVREMLVPVRRIIVVVLLVRVNVVAFGFTSRITTSTMTTTQWIFSRILRGYVTTICGRCHCCEQEPLTAVRATADQLQTTIAADAVSRVVPGRPLFVALSRKKICDVDHRNYRIRRTVVA